MCGSVEKGVSEQMKVYAVFVHCTAAGFASRWIDTQWATAQKASERALELDHIFSAFNAAAHKTSVVELSVVDVSITGKPE